MDNAKKPEPREKPDAELTDEEAKKAQGGGGAAPIVVVPSVPGSCFWQPFSAPTCSLRDGGEKQIDT